MDQKLDEVTADLASLKGKFIGLKDDFKLLEVSVNKRLTTFEATISLKINEAINTNLRFSIALIALIALIVTILKLADMFIT